LPEVEGKMPQDKQKCLNVISRYLSLSEEERLNFILGRRMGYYERLDDLADSQKHDKLDEFIARINSEGKSVEQLVSRLKDSFI
ncbi:MAG: radical SAM protein, partial [Dehalococcoidia bacterium]|nr:radical SAM protein [Dehalococcoidia bacterium]